ncbi:carbamoyltransferase [Motiliproteus sp. MSK22-1]|uniref:carbamoyltransferase family protein n=1 Tax=Motiliproteus sp. MSK22-1 TaxID=1897630 RepID=UPI000977BE02|nr:carbamoyltransferase [Motiliproteus sp. MSK22-1]OMH25698.1 hypothetical protein BGP75_24475 [Motiliproteus sp. MSK22-1]
MIGKQILGISAFYHDSAAALVQSGELIAAAQEERFSRIRHDAAFPEQSIISCLNQADIKITDLDAIVFYDKPFLTFDRILETYLSYAPLGIRSFLRSMPIWLKEKLTLKILLKKHLARLAKCKEKQLPKLLFTEHHQSHAASAFYPSPYEKAAVLCLDGVGEWATTSAWMGDGKALTPLWQINFPHSLGLLYSAFTYFCGFRVNSGEYKLMGLAPYGIPRYRKLILDKVITVKADGSFQLNLDYFDFCVGSKMTNESFSLLFDGPPRVPESPITQRELDLAASVQAVTEEIILKLAKTLRDETQARNLCLAGGVALNCTANGKLLRSGLFDEIWVQPAAGDAGGAVGSAFAASFQYYQEDRSTTQTNVTTDSSTPSLNGNGNTKDDSMQGAYLGPDFSNREIQAFLDDKNIPYTLYDDSLLFDEVAGVIASGNVVGWFQGRMEFGPRALGNRSILADARNSEMQSKLNLKIKFRESFRPFAPAVLSEKAQEYFEQQQSSPYMLFTAPVSENIISPEGIAEMEQLDGLEKLSVTRSRLPATTHVDMTARIQTVNKKTNPRFHQLLTAFNNLTGCAAMINTSFNVRGEPIVCSLNDAFDCFINTHMDYLVLGNYVLEKKKQLAPQNTERYFELD